VVFDKKTTLGLIRIKVNQTSQRMESLFTKIYEKIEKEYKSNIDSDFFKEAESELDNLFK